jgi:hypothetical protein
MKRTFLIALIGTLALAGCLQEERYPISNQECGPDDPVKELTVPDCAPSV